MAAPGCNHARQAGWRDGDVLRELASLVVPCRGAGGGAAFCRKLVVDRSLDDGVLGDDDNGIVAAPTQNTLAGRCKFCSTYRTDIRRADPIKQALTQYNMALLSAEGRATAGAHMEAAFQRAVDEAALAYGPDPDADGSGRRADVALRVLDDGFRRAGAEVGALCGEKQLAPYQEWYGGGYRGPGG
ncbi:hypothetical protein GGR56DRAFT_680902 [Xylariaceae sp. FL0804]|nr:hypothetical protein GGR56DRAFT_680902 [Xylariaceae sp. FL0804]